MNRFARIMQGVGWAATAAWVVAWAQGFAVEGERSEIAMHTLVALAGAAAALLGRVWTMVFLGLRRNLRPEAPLSFRAVAIAGTVSLLFVAATFATSGQILWRRVPPLAHAALGLGLLASHVWALVAERRALREDAARNPAL